MRARLGVALALLLVACGGDFAPVSEIGGFRVLGLRASPPDLHPGDTAALDSLVVDPTDPSLPTSILYLACDPDPSGLGSNPCSQYQTVADAQNIFLPDGGLPPGAHFLGINTGSYTAPAHLFDGVPADATVRQAGALAVVLAVALGADVTALPSGSGASELLQKVLTRQIPSQLVIKRIRVADDPALNHNPVLGLVATDVDELRPGRPLLALPGQTVPLQARAASGAQEAYVAIGPDGTEDPRTEQAVLSWFTSAGSFNDDRTLDTDTDQTFTAPDGSAADLAHAIPADRAFTLWVVLRDGRGGEDWQALPGLVCDPTLPAMQLSSASVVDGAIRLDGAHLDQLVDAALDGQPLTGVFQSGEAAFIARLPAGATGAHLVEARDRGCRRAQVPLIAP